MAIRKVPSPRVPKEVDTTSMAGIGLLGAARIKPLTTATARLDTVTTGPTKSAHPSPILLSYEPL